MKKHTNWAAICYMARDLTVMAAATVYQMREQLAQLSAAIRADGERIAHRKKPIMAPGEMESFTLTREALGDTAQEVVFCVEEE